MTNYESERIFGILNYKIKLLNSNFCCFKANICANVSGCVGGGGGAFSSITGVPTEVAYFDSVGNGTSDSQFTRIEATHDTSLLRTPTLVTGVMGFETLEALEPESTLYGLPVTGSHMIWNDITGTGLFGTIYAIANPSDGTPFLSMIAMDTAAGNGGNISMFKNNGDTWKANMTTDNYSVLGHSSFITSESSDTLSRNEIESYDQNTQEKSTIETRVTQLSLSHKNPGLDFESSAIFNDNSVYLRATTISTSDAASFLLTQTGTSFGDTGAIFGGNMFQMNYNSVIQYGDLNSVDSRIYRTTNTNLGYDYVHGLKNSNYTGVSFVGTGVNNMTASVFYTLNVARTYDIVIDSSGLTDTFEWKIDGVTQATGVIITAGFLQVLDSAVSISFMTDTGHNLADLWSFSFNPSFGTAQYFDFNNAQITTGDVNDILTHTKQIIDVGGGNYIWDKLGANGQYLVSDLGDNPLLYINEGTHVMWLGMGNGLGNGMGIKVDDVNSTIVIGDIFGNGSRIGINKSNNTIEIYGNSNDLFLTIDGATQAIVANKPVRLKQYSVATLPTGGNVGDTACVTDALAPAFGVNVVGGGGVIIPVFYNGSHWVAG